MSNKETEQFKALSKHIDGGEWPTMDIRISNQLALMIRQLKEINNNLLDVETAVHGIGDNVEYIKEKE